MINERIDDTNYTDIDSAKTNVGDLIMVQQLPVIVQQLQAISVQIEEQTAYALSLEVTEDNYKEIKKIRSGLNASFNALEDRRKEVKKAILAPYEEFDGIYKQFVTDKYKPAAQQLNSRISAVEDGLKQKKSDEAKEYFDEYTRSKNIDFISFQQLDIPITLNTSKKSIKEKIKAIIDKVADDLAMINTQQYKAEILVEYKRTLNVSQAILTVTNRIKAIEEERARVEAAELAAEEEATTIAKVDEAIEESISAPVEFDIPDVTEMPTEANVEDATPTDGSDSIKTVYQARFAVFTENLEHLRTLKRLLDELKKEGLKYEQF